MAESPTAAMIVIGDEILSGRTRDSNLHHLAGRLTEHGIDMVEARVIPDDAGVITATVAALAARVDHVFTSGGIGPTHDDITADAVAAAFDRPIDVRTDARERLEAHYARREVELNAARLRMARIPDGAELIDNPVSAAPGFSLENVHVMAGIPQIFEAMVESLLPRLTGGTPRQSRSLDVRRGEGDIAEVLGRMTADFPDLAFGSYPSQTDRGIVVNVVVRGTDPDRLDAAIEALRGSFPEPAA